MKLNISIDCTPEEARRFLGMPDMAEAQEMIAKAMRENIANMDPDALMKYWMPMMQQGSTDWGETMGKNMQMWQALFTNAMSETAQSDQKDNKDKE